MKIRTKRRTVIGGFCLIVLAVTVIGARAQQVTSPSVPAGPGVVPAMVVVTDESAETSAVTAEASQPAAETSAPAATPAAAETAAAEAPPVATETPPAAEASAPAAETPAPTSEEEAEEPAEEPAAAEPATSEPAAQPPAEPAVPAPGPAMTRPVAGSKALAAQARPPAEVPPLSERVELHVKDADLLVELRLLAEQHRLNIIAGKDVTGKVTADLYDVTIEDALKAILDMNGYGFRRVDDFIYVHTKQQLKDIAAAEAKIDTRTYSLSYINVDDAREVIKPALSKSAIVATTLRAKAGIPSGGEQVGGDDYGLQDKLIVTDFEDNLKKVEAILKEVDVRPKQVLVEATILQVTLDDETSLGVDFNVLAGVDFRDVTLVGTLPVSNPNSIAASATATQAQIPFGRVGTTGFATPGNGFQIGVITNDVSVFVQALEEVKDVNVLSNPKVLALNKQRAEVLVGSRLGYRTTETTATSEVETIQFLDIGTQLQFRPYVSDDGFVRMEIHPKVSSGDVDAAGLPREDTTEVTCNVMVRDGHTIVIGGLFDESTQIDKLQVPGLGNLPLAGALFRKDHQTTLRHEVIILLTPHIIDHGVANVEGRQMLQYVERATSNLRSRFPLYTREKLTHLHLSDASKNYTRYLATGKEQDRTAALWSAKQARHVAPNNREAYVLLDKLEAEEVVRRPRLRNESALWKRMMEQGLVKELPGSGSGEK